MKKYTLKYFKPTKAGDGSALIITASNVRSKVFFTMMKQKPGTRNNFDGKNTLVFTLNYHELAKLIPVIGKQGQSWSVIHTFNNAMQTQVWFNNQGDFANITAKKGEAVFRMGFRKDELYGLAYALNKILDLLLEAQAYEDTEAYKAYQAQNQNAVQAPTQIPPIPNASPSPQQQNLPFDNTPTNPSIPGVPENQTNVGLENLGQKTPNQNENTSDYGIPDMPDVPF